MVVQCELLSLHRSGVYYAPRPVDERTLLIQRRIDEIYTACPFYGIRKITAQLRQDGLLVNHKAVARHMQSHGAAGDLPRTQSEQTRPAARRLPVSAAWTEDRASQSGLGRGHHLHPPALGLAVSVRGAGLVLAFRRQLDTRPDAGDGLRAGGDAGRAGNGDPRHLQQRPGQPFHQPAVYALFQDTPVQISMDGKGRALDNIFTERLWRTVKYEEVYLKEYASPREARTGLGEYLDFYNYRRLHQALDYQTPAQIYFKEGEQSTDKIDSFYCLDEGVHFSRLKSITHQSGNCHLGQWAYLCATRYTA